MGRYVAATAAAVNLSADAILLDGNGYFPYILHAMITLTITTKGQLTLRRDLIRHLGLRPGDRVEVDALPQGRIELRAARRVGRIDDVFNLLRRPGTPALTLEEMNEIAAQGWSGRR